MANALMTAYRPTLRDRAANALVGALGDTYGARKFSRRLLGSSGIGSTGGGLVDWTPAGVPLALEEGGAQIGAGHPWKGAGNVALAVLPIPAAAKVAKKAAGKAATALAPDAARVARATLPTGDLDMAWLTRDVNPGAMTYGNLNRAQVRATNQMRDAEDFAEVEVPISRLIATQNKVNPDFAEAAGRHAETGHKPAVYKVGGELVLSDGHHRVANAAASGKQTVPVRLYDVDQHLAGDQPGPAQPDLFDLAERLAPAPEAAPADDLAERLTGPKGFTAYHGSPHEFDRFDLDKIGTGEGAQAYGHGLYFADREGTARAYRDNLASMTAKVGGQGMRNFTYSDTEPFLDAIRQEAERRGVSLDVPLHGKRHLFATDAADIMDEALVAAEDVPGAIAWLKEKAETEPDRLVSTYLPRDEAEAVGQTYAQTARLMEQLVEPNPGHMYEVRINADPEDFLDWDSPIARDQLAERLSAFPEVLDADAGRRRLLGPDKGFTGKDVYAKAAGWNPNAELSPPNAGEVTQRFAEAGIPGIRYLDQGSRGAAEVNELRGTVGMWETAARKAPGDTYAADMLARAKADLAEAEQGLTRNYVVFNDRLIDVMRRYGVAAPVAAAMLASGQYKAGGSATENQENRP